MTATLAESLVDAPRLSAPAEARRRLAALVDTASSAKLKRELERGRTRDVLLGLADHSPHLWTLVQEDPARLVRLLARPPGESLDALVQTLVLRRDEHEADLMPALRRAKREAALLVALADVGGVWDVVAATEALTRFADSAVRATLAFLLRKHARAGLLALDPDVPDVESGSGLVVLALGKHGARELNYSSDIDLIVLFDAAASSIPQGTEPGPLFVRLTKALARLLQERTGDGYVLRVDLRLRPDPASTPVALATSSAYQYYETVGQNWERAALIKARPAAGDLKLGERFLTDLAPFIWRKYFDYAAIADIHAMKRQIHAVRGHERVVVPGHDVKLGRGGIREIEFFVQTQQLIFGGRRPQMRGSRTLDMLQQLCADKWISADAVDDLSLAYAFLRRVEHRLQMVADEQTQRLPFEREALTRFAKFCGYARLDGFVTDLTHHMTQVERHYAQLFEDAPELSVASGDLVFTGVTDDPATLTTLSALGFQRPDVAAETVRGWHFGRRAAVRSARAREVLTELTPALLEAFAGSGDADAALSAFDEALARMPASVELLSILRSNASLRELFGDVLGSAPRLAQVIASRPHVLDAAIDPARSLDFDLSFDDEAMGARVETFVSQGQSFEDALNRSRDFAAEETFHIGLNLLSGRLDPDRAGRAYSALAQGLIAALLKRVIEAFVAEHGRIRGGRVAIVALGKLGSREMNAASDLDLMLIYDFPVDASEFGRPEATRSHALLRAPDATAHLGSDGADQSWPPVRSRHAPQAFGPSGPGRDPVCVVQALPAGRGGDLGAHGADPRSFRRGGCEPRGRRRQDGAADADPQTRRRQNRPGDPRHAWPHRQGKGPRRCLGPQAGRGRTDRHRVRRPVSAIGFRARPSDDPRRLDPQGLGRGKPCAPDHPGTSRNPC